MSNQAQPTPSPRKKPSPVTARQLYEISAIFTAKADWKEALEDALPFIRKIMVYDVFSVYLADPMTRQLEIGFARAAGRGKDHAADLEWGSRIALQIMENPRTIYESPDHVDQNRLDSPFILGSPLLLGSQPLGALVFVRFGGPRFNRTHIRLVEFLSRQLAVLVDKKIFQSKTSSSATGITPTSSRMISSLPFRTSCAPPWALLKAIPPRYCAAIPPGNPTNNANS